MRKNVSEKTLMQILAACDEFSTMKAVAEKAGMKLGTVKCGMRQLGDYVIRDKKVYPWQYKRNPDKLFVPQPLSKREAAQRDRKVREWDRTGLLLPQGPLSVLRQCERYALSIGRLVEETHSSSVDRKSVPHIGCGSQAHVELLGH